MAHLAKLLPSDEEINKWESIGDAAKWAKLPEDFFTLFTKEMGEEVIPDMQTMAAIEVMDIKHVVKNMKVPILKKTRLNLMLNSLRKRYGMQLVDYTKEPEPVLPPQPVMDPNLVQAIAKGSKETAGNAVRVAHVLDQAFREEMEPLDEDIVNKCRQELHARLEGEPLEAEEFSDSQLTAFKRRVDSGGSPACDYGVLGPYGCRIVRRMNFRTVIKDQMGHERTIEVAGPDTVDTWEACHQVFRSLALACKVCKSSTLENYRSKFKERCLEFPTQWALAMMADAICRTEHWARLKSLHKRIYDDPATRAFSSYDPAMPWDSAIAASTVDSDFWAKHFDRPAQRALSDHKASTPIHAQQQGGEEDEAPSKRARNRNRGGRAREKADARRQDGRSYTDVNSMRFCRAYHEDNNSRGLCRYSHNCEYCRKAHRSMNCWSNSRRQSNSGGKQGGDSKGGGEGQGKYGGGGSRAW